MTTKTLKNLILSASVAVFATSCGTSTTDGGALGGVGKAAGDAAVDAATEKANPLTGAAVRSATGLGTDPVEKASTGLLNKVGL